jgi:flagellar biosynthesis component FlhA
VRILDNVQLEANSYIIKVKEVDAGTGQVIRAATWSWIRTAAR